MENVGRLIDLSEPSISCLFREYFVDQARSALGGTVTSKALDVQRRVSLPILKVEASTAEQLSEA